MWTPLIEHSKAKFKSNKDRPSPCFKPFLIENMSDKHLPTRDSVICFSQTHFYWPYQFIQYLPPNWIISFLEVYKELMHCCTVFPFFLKYLTNAEYMIRQACDHLQKKKIYVKNITGYNFQTEYQDQCNTRTLFQTTNSLHTEF